MAEQIDISATARVLDEASGPLKAITGLITGVGAAAKATSSAFSSLGGTAGGALGGVTEGFKKAGGSVLDFGKKFSGVFGAVTGLTGVAGIAGMTAATQKFIRVGEELYKAADAFKVTTGVMQAVQEAAGGPEKAAAALGKLQGTLKTFTETGKDADSVVVLLKKFGATAQEIKDGNFGALLPKIAEGFRINTDPALRAKMAIALFGEENKDLIARLAQGKVSLAELAAAMEKVNSSADIKNAHEASEALKEMNKQVDRLTNSIGAQLLPVFTPLIKVVSDFVEHNRELIKQTALPAFIGLVTTSLISLGVAAAGALGPWGLLVAAVIAGGVAIYQNWDKIKAFFDSSLPGFLPALQSIGDGISSWAKKASADITAGFQTGGISGGLQAIWDSLKTGATDAVAWIGKQFSGIDWSATGKGMADMIWAGLSAAWQAEIDLGNAILAKLQAIDWGNVAKFMIDGIATYFSASGDAWEWFASLDWTKVGTDIGKLIGEAIVLAFKAAGWLMELPGKIIEAFVNADYSGIGNAIKDYFSKLGSALLKIGAELISGLIDGMMSAIPGLSKVTAGIKGAIGSAGSWFERRADDVGNLFSKPPSPSWDPNNPNPNAPPSLLRRDPAGQVNRNDTTVTLKLPPGVTATTESTTSGGAPPKVEVGQSGVGVGYP
jgi:hypothetical protein